MSYKTSYQKCKIFILNNIIFGRINSKILYFKNNSTNNTIYQFLSTANIPLEGGGKNNYEIINEYHKYLHNNNYNSTCSDIINLFTKWLYKFLSKAHNTYSNYLLDKHYYWKRSYCTDCVIYPKMCNNNKFHLEIHIFRNYLRDNFLLINPECINIFMQIIDTMKKEKYLLLRRCIFLIN